MRIAVYAPLKPPDDPTPSGDRRVARALGAAIAHAGHTVDWPSRLRSFDRRGDPLRQARLARLGARVSSRLLRGYAGGKPRPDLWLTYHLYYKAPDHLGPPIARRLGIPYVVAEASVAMKRAGGAWDIGHRAVLDALSHARAVVSLNPRDDAALDAHLAAGCARVALAPFMALSPPPGARRPEAAHVRLLAVAMMRPGDKARSFALLAQALTRIEDRPWRLRIAGDGEARAAVEAMFARFGDRVTFLGLRDETDLAADLATADIFVWPAINEAFGMALLEAQAAGVPAVAGDFGAVGSILADGETGLLAGPDSTADFADKLARLIDDADLRARMGRAARAKAERAHGIDVAARELDALFRRLAA
ncbi:MAG: glycosyltransferase family 4 protein [Tagaea sp.]